MRLNQNNVYREEAFTPHYNEKPILDIEKAFEEIYQNFKDERISPTKASLNDLVGDQVATIEKIVRIRFGFNIRIRNSNTMLATRIPTPKSYSGMINGRERYKELKEALEKVAKNPGDLEKFMKQTDELDKHLKIDKIKVDLDKLYIDNLPETFRPDIYINFNQLCDSRGRITPKQLTAGFLHEVGHIFTFLCYSYRCRLKKLSFEEAIRDKSMDINKKATKYLVGYDGSGHIKDPIVVLDTVKSMVYDVTNNLYVNSTDKEYIADAFVTSLGYGDSLTNFLVNLTILDPAYMTAGNMLDIITTVAANAFAADMLLLMFMIVLSLTISPLFLFYVYVYLGIAFIILTVTLGGIVIATLRPKRKDLSYDDIVLRIEKQRRVAVDNITKLTHAKADPELINDAIARLETIEENKKAMKELTKKGPVDKLVEYILGISNSYTQTKEYAEFKDSIEALIYNDLHVAQAKLKLGVRK